MTIPEGDARTRRGYKVVFCLRRRAELSHDEFLNRWSGRHAELALEGFANLGAVRYVQNHSLHGPLNDALRSSRGAPEAYDGVVELWFESLYDVRGTFTQDAARKTMKALLADERDFIDIARSPIFVVEEHIIYEVAS